MKKGESFSVRPDSKGRITLGKHARGISSFIVTRERSGRLILEPRVEISAREKWLLENNEALSCIKRGIEDAEKGKLKSEGSFSKYSTSKDK
ncbi:MAG: hypothetical protein A3F16_02420 [Deltaproteobacteria bacterium RIFCSPHIGHO2_12_FULL_43_9]|nr:MAG: hypothetical protein A3F16_02420 [Deltaproteobacteria bacterium RIFCSPHIGHO2_12_FULL_43_9]